MENKVCDECKVAEEIEEVDAALEIRKNLLEAWEDALDTWQDSLEKQARMNRRVMMFNIATSVILLGMSLVKLFVG